MSRPPVLRVFADGDELARAAAAEVADRIRAVTSAGHRFAFAVSGGRTPWAMLAQLRDLEVRWDLLDVFQVDERVAPEGDSSRNLTHLVAALPPAAAVHAMPVGASDLERAAADYAAELPDRFDLVHLGLGPDGHTASLVPGDPVLDVADRTVALTEPYQGHRRMTLTYAGLARADSVLWLVAGADKVDALDRLMAGDLGIPAARVDVADQVAFVDRAAMG